MPFYAIRTFNGDLLSLMLVRASDGQRWNFSTNAWATYSSGSAANFVLNLVDDGAASGRLIRDAVPTGFAAATTTGTEVAVFVLRRSGTSITSAEVQVAPVNAGVHYIWNGDAAVLSLQSPAEYQAWISTSRLTSARATLLDNLTGSTLEALQADTDNIQTRLPAALLGGRMDSSVGAMANNSVTAAALATDAVAEIADGVWDEALSGHGAAGSTGKTLSDVAISTSSSFAVLGMKLVIDGQDCDCETLPRLTVRKSDSRDVTFWVVDGDDTHLPIPSSVTPTLVDATGSEVGSAELIDIKASIGYLKVRLAIPSTGTMPASLILLFDGGSGATWTWEVLLTVL